LSIIITSNEPREIKNAFGDLAIEIPLEGFDILLYTQRGKIPIERKHIPDDLLASVTDGRLQRELAAMRQVSKFPILLCHGRFTYSTDGTLVMGRRRQNWTKKGIRNLCRTIRYVEGIDIEWADTVEDMVETVQEIEKYFNQTHHLSLKIRPGIHTNWLVPSRSEKIQYFYQGLPIISAIRAKELEKKYPYPIDLYGATIDDLMTIPGFGRTIAKGIYDFLRRG